MRNLTSIGERRTSSATSERQRMTCPMPMWVPPSTRITNVSGGILREHLAQTGGAFAGQDLAGLRAVVEEQIHRGERRDERLVALPVDRVVEFLKPNRDACVMEDVNIEVLLT